MKLHESACFPQTKDVRVDTVDDPTIEGPGDAIIRVTSTAICGSDLHMDDIITYRLPLDQASKAYEIFDEKKDNCVKVVLKPHG